MNKINAIIDEYNKEINIFWNEPDSTERTYGNWDLIMMTYEELCKRLPFVPFTIVGNLVYLEGQQVGSFQNSMFFAVGECCKRYNNREYSIRYE